MNELLDRMINYLFTVAKQEKITYKIIDLYLRPTTIQAKRQLVEYLTNIMPPHNHSIEFIQDQDELLQSEKQDITRARGLPKLVQQSSEFSDLIRLWKGDITKLEVDCIVNAANKDLTGCYIPLHNCIDSIIHSKSGVQLRYECSLSPLAGNANIGCSVLTDGYNLPARHVVHTVGPQVIRLNRTVKTQLRNCYLNCLNTASQAGCLGIAFCCISTGQFGFPNLEAAKIAIQTVNEWLEDNQMLVVFCTYDQKDFSIYKELLCEGFDATDIDSNEYLTSDDNSVDSLENSSDTSDRSKSESGSV
ncbi:Macro domain-containing protein [Entamoeba marina]